MRLRVKGYLAITDHDWFTFLGERQPLDEVNFWQPSAHGFRAAPGTPFLFKLKAPHNAIGGFGVFARYEEASPTLAWEAFGEKNGAPSFPEMWRRIGRYARRPGDPSHRIGCIMVADPVFLPPEEWIPQPRDWKPNIVSGAGIDLSIGEGRRVWEACQARCGGDRAPGQPGLAAEPPHQLPRELCCNRNGSRATMVTGEPRLN